MNIKKSSRIAFFLLGFATIVNAQTFVDQKAFALMKPNNTAKGLYLNNSINQAIQILGTPSSTKEEYYEIQEAMAKVLIYNGNRLSFINDSLYSYEITTPDILIGTVKGKTFKVGDKIESKTIQIPLGPAPFDPVSTKIVYSFMGYPVNIEKGISRNISYTAYTSINLADGNGPLDAFVDILFKNNILINIGIGHP